MFIKEFIALVNKGDSVFHCVCMQVYLLKQFKRPTHLVEPNRPSLPLLVGSYILIQNPFL